MQKSPKHHGMRYERRASQKLTARYVFASATRAGAYRRHHPSVDFVRAEILVRRTVGENFRTGLGR